MEVIDYNKYENYIRVGKTKTSLKDFPTPSTLTITLHDVDKDAYTDLKGYTHRNRVRHDVYDIQLGYSVLSDADLAFILNAISPQWFYVELTDKKTLKKSVHKMYASDKEFDTYRVIKGDDNQYHTIHQSFSVSFIEE